MNTPATTSEQLLLTAVQQDIYFDQLHFVELPLYNVGGYIALPSIDPDRMQVAHQLLINQHDVFGIQLQETPQGIRQFISSQRDTRLPILDFSEAADPKADADQWLSNHFRQTMALHNSPLFTAHLLKLNDHCWYYVGKAHHLCMDGWGFANWAANLSSYYQSGVSTIAGKSWPDVIQQDLSYRQSDRYQTDGQYWRQSLQQLPEQLFARQYLRALEHTATPGQRQILHLSSERTAAVAALAGQLQVPVAQLYHAVVALYFSRCYQQSQLLFGCPVHNRSTKADKVSLGVFVSVIPVLLELQPDMTLPALCRQIAQKNRQNYKHQRFPVGDMFRDMVKSQGRERLYDIGFNYLRLDSQLAFDGKSAHLVYLSHQHEQNPLMLTIWEYGDSGHVEIQADFNLQYFSPMEVTLLLNRFELLLDQLLQQPDLPACHYQLLPAAEQVLLKQFAEGPVLTFDTQTLAHHLFEQQARDNPDKIALICGAEQRSYAALNQQANQLAHLLINADLPDSAFVGIHCQRSVYMVVAVLAAMKAGLPFVALDPDYPVQRLNYMVADSQIALILSQSSLSASFGQTPVILLDTESALIKNPAHNVQSARVIAERIAYCIYTSGSTGQPKGVLIRQYNLLALLHWARQTYSDIQLRSVLASTSLNFDLSMFELFVPLCFGFQCVLVRNPLALLEQSVDVSLINTVPSAARALLQAAAVPVSVHTVNLAGEPLSASIVNSLLQLDSCQAVYNLYGPSEDTTYSTFACFTSPIARVPEIGKVIAGSQAYVLSPTLEQVPVGCVGELYLGGAGVAAGYQGKAALTADRFIRLSAQSGLCYRTGDLVRFLPDGSLAYLGRADDQVKLRGFRIEPGEIEHCLLALPGVSQAVVMITQQRLIAYLVASSCDSASLKAQLAQQLPTHMLPDQLIFLAALPLTPNGKIDKKALPEPVNNELVPVDGLPANETEQRLAALVALLLKQSIETINMQLSFFGNGGHSLSAVALIGQVAQTFGVQLSLPQIFSHNSLRQLSHLLDEGTSSPSVYIIATDLQTPAPISLLQQRLWLLHQVQGAAANYHMPFALQFNTEVEPKLLEQVLISLLQRHQILRSVYQQTETTVQLVPQPATAFSLVVESATDLTTAQFTDLLQQKSAEPFNLTVDLPLRACLYLRYQDGQAAPVLWLCAHHLALDGQSVLLLLKELVQHWQAAVNQLPVEVPPPVLQYHDFARWQQQQLADGAFDEQIEYWRQQLVGAPLRHSLPGVLSHSGNTGSVGLHRQVIPAALLQRVQLAAKTNQMTVFMQLHAALALLLSRAGNCQDVLIATAVSNRPTLQLTQTIGFFVNTLVLRVNTAQPDIGQYLQHVRAVHLAAQQHQDLPFDLVVQACQVARDASYLPLSQILLTYQTQTPADVLTHDMPFEWYPLVAQLQKYELEIDITETSSQATVSWSYQQALFTPELIEQLSQNYLVILEEIVGRQLSENQDAPLHQIAGMPAAEREFLLNRLNDNHLPFDADATLGSLFTQQAYLMPQQVVLTIGQRRWCYLELAEMVNALAQRLVLAGVGQGDLVGVCCRRDLTMVVAVLAVLQAGAGYVPIDPAYPTSRQQHIISASQIRLLLSNDGLADSLQVAQLLLLDEKTLEQQRLPAPVSLQAKAQDIAYVIYTSGSTGLPKGVAITHRNAVALLCWAQQQYQSTELQQVLACTSLSFDLSVFELFVPLCLGYQCVLVDNALALLSSQPAVTLINTVPSAIRTLLEQGAIPPSTRVINLAGEPLPGELLNQLLAFGVPKVCNLYGPTEDTTYSTCAVFSAPVADSPVIGRVINNSQAYILSGSQELLPFGVPGELYLGGAGVASGYLGQSALTAAKFIANPYGPGLLYRTGDLVRYANRHGCLAFLGRLDDQVKIRGFRLELGEIEQVLLQLSVVKAACVLACGDGEQRQLRAFVVVNVNDPGIMQQLRDQLATHLPDYMQPASIRLLDTLPLTPNGKTDKAALSQLEDEAKPVIVAPATALEVALTVIWAQVLQKETTTCCVNEHFFQSGGHSLLAVRLSTEISRTLQLDCSAQLIFQCPTIRLLANQLANQQLPSSLIPTTDDNDELVPLSFAQQRIWFLTQLAPDDDAFNLSATLQVYGQFRPSLLPQVLAALVQRQQILQYRVVQLQGEPVLQREPASVVPFNLVDLSDLPQEEQQEAMQSLRQVHANYRFDPSADMLIRLTYVQLCKASSKQNTTELCGLIMLTLHHLVADGGSVPLLLADFMTAYQALQRGDNAQLPALAVSYADFCRWQRNRFNAALLAQQTAYWQELLAEAPPAHSLPLASARGAQPVRGAQFEQVLPKALCQQLGAHSCEHDVTLFMLLQAALALHIGRLSHQYDVVIGAPVDGRQHHQLQPLVGLLLNTTLYRTEFSDNPSWSMLLQRTKDQHIRSLSYQDVPFEAIVEKINPGRDLHQAPLFQILLNYHNTALPPLELSECRLTLQAELTQNAKYDLTLYVTGDTARGISLHWAYNQALFHADTLQFYANEFVYLLTQLCAAPQTPVLQFGWQQRPDWPAAVQVPAQDQQLWQLIEQQVQRHPNLPALRCDELRYSYRELAGAVNQLANYLRQLGFVAGQRAAVLMQRDTQRVISILAVLKLGGAYVPLSQELPEQRLMYMLDCAAPTLLLTDTISQQDYSVLCDSFSGQTLCIDSVQSKAMRNAASDMCIAVPRMPADEAHIIFTSGSTGLPKGVAGTCQATLNRVQWMLETYPYQLGEPVAHITSMAFIRGVWELLVPLCGGAELVLCDRSVVRDSAKLWHWLKHQQIRRLVTAPSLMKALTDIACDRQETALMPLRYWFVSGEPLLQQHANSVLQHFPQLRLFNLYGSTEVMSDVLVKEICPDLQQRWVTLGKPICGTSVCILASDGLPAPDGVVGEIAVLGAALANGYITDPAHPSFVATDAGRLYRTGDFGIRGINGEFSCFGRRDDQIKIRGYRVEPGEVRAVLTRHPAVQNCLVRPWQQGQQNLLVAYIVATVSAEARVMLREQLIELVRANLPAYMQVAAWLFMDALPLRPNGKVDRQALPAPDLVALQAERVAPVNEIEQQLCLLWGQLLRLEPAEIGVTSCFFELGGHSLLVAQLSHQLQERFNLVLTYQEFFANSTIRYQASRIAHIKQLEAVMKPKAAADSLQKILF